MEYACPFYQHNSSNNVISNTHKRRSGWLGSRGGAHESSAIASRQFWRKVLWGGLFPEDRSEVGLDYLGSLTKFTFTGSIGAVFSAQLPLYLYLLGNGDVLGDALL